MKKKFILFPIATILFYFSLSSMSSGPGSDLYPSSGCSCHSPSASASTTVSLQLLKAGTPVTTYVAGQSYTIRITGTNTGATSLPMFGFQLGANSTATPSLGAGTLTPDGSSHLVSAGVNIVEHSSPQSPFSGTGATGTVYRKDITWTAPAAGFGTVTIRGIINAVNGLSGADGGDKWNSGSSNIQELGAISGTASVCVSQTTTLSNALAGGTWSSSSAGIATVSASGVVSGIAAGTSTITYTAGGNFVTHVVTVNANPGSFGGTATVCMTGTTTLSNATGGGTWASGNTSIATVVSGTGVVTGVAAGTTLMTYAIGTCSATTTVTVNPLAPNTGTPTVCAGSTTTLANANSGGVWSSSNNAIAQVSTSGVVTGISAGTANISYVLPSGCTAVTNATVSAVPAVIGGTLTVCPGTTVNVTNAISGGTWSTSAGSGSVSIGAASGVVTGSSTGTANITYTLTGGCFETAVVTVNPLPSPITGTTTFCANATTTLSSATPGGTWSSSNTSVATAGLSSGIITGAGSAGGAALISYILPTGCFRFTNVNVQAITPISGTLTLCGGETATLTSGPAGGTWSSSATAVVTVNATSGLIGGVTLGTSTISYTATNGCRATAIATVNTGAPVTGGGAVCNGGTLTLSNSVSGGIWSSSNTAVGTISTAGVFTALSTGTSSVTYTNPGGCATATTITVNAVPAAVTGSGSGTFCGSATITASGGSGGTIYYQGTTSGGTSTATPSTSQLVTSTGTYYFRSQSAAGCWGPEAAISVTINPTPAAISGIAAICEGSSSPLSTTPAGGTWASSTPAVGTIDITSGMFSALSTGTTTVTYTTGAGCIVTGVVTVNAAPGAVTGAGGGTFCVSATITASGGAGGTIFYQGTTSGGTSTATPSTSQVVTTTGTHYFRVRSASGCWGSEAGIAVVINPTPAAISGPGSVCAGSTVTLTSATGGGTWSTSTPAIATINTTTGVATGVAAGTTTITYTSGAGCITTRTLTVTALPTGISGPSAVCAGSSITLSGSPGSGTWSSSNTLIATASATTGSITGVNSGIAHITYTLPSGCSIATPITVNALPATIAGAGSPLCAGNATTLTSATPGGTWTSSNTGVATISSSIGTLSAIAAGTSTITYQSGTGCIRTTEVTVNPLPSAITGNTTPCTGTSNTLSAIPMGGTWFSSNSSVATINTTTGVMNTASSGTTNITYTLPTGCSSTTTVTVSAAPSAISGTAAACVGTSTTLSSSPAGGTWSSDNTAVATAGATTGIVTGVTAGTATISYSVSAGCAATTVATINTAPTAGTISGSASVCTGLNITLTSTVAGGTWSSSNSSIATINSTTGEVTGVLAGVVTMTYTRSTTCGPVFATHNITVTTSAVSGSITGPTSVCPGSAITLSSTVTGGTWSSSAPAIATINTSTGVLNGLTIGTTTISYVISSSCGTATTSTVVAVNPLPPAIAGSPTVCTNATLTLPTSGTGTWASGNTAVAIINAATGDVTGVSPGTALVTYTLSTGCATTGTVTVLPPPANITGSLAICAGSITTLSNTSTGGSWSSTNTAVATIGTSSGTVISLTPGTSLISYTLATTGCASTAVLTVNPVPASITGMSALCPGGNLTLSSTTTGGIWSSSNASVASVSSTGLLSAGAAGTAFITYALPTGCRRLAIATVNALPSAISGTLVACEGNSVTLSSLPAGGMWSSDNTTVATAGATTGVVNAISSGTANITYTAATGCIRTAVFSVNPTPGAVTGTATLCAGATTTLTSSTAGGVWTSNNTPVATISAATGNITAVAAGTAVISYALGTGCNSTMTVTVNALPATISGSTAICEGVMGMLTSSPAGGTWVGSDAALATIDAVTGGIAGIMAGELSVTYTLPTGCMRSRNVTVNATPAAITGTLAVCQSNMETLSTASTGGGWSSANPAVASINTTTGVLTGVTPGTVAISYSFITGCRKTAIATVNALPAPVAGPSAVCPGSGITLTSTSSGGTWSSSDATIATAGTTSGTITGVTAGTAIITYTLPTGCMRTYAITVNALPDAGSITGPDAVCAASTITITPSVAGGFWSMTSGHATITAAGVMTGISSGEDTVVYSVTNVCGTDYALHTVTVNPLPVSGLISGGTILCTGGASTLSSTGTGGSWSSSNNSIASVSGLGIVLASTPGTVTISYTVTNICGTAVSTVNVTVLSIANAGVISGADSVCMGDTIHMASTMSGGMWLSSATGIASVSSAGVVTGIAPGTVIIRYVVSNACSTDTSSRTVTVSDAGACATRITATANNMTVRIFPNPTSGIVTIAAPAAGTIVVYSADGREVCRHTTSSGTYTFTLPADLAAGVYVCRFNDELGNVTMATLVYTP